MLEALYIVFRVTPFSKNIARSIVKEPKIYFFDSGLVIGDEGARLENFTAVSLLKHVYGKNDYLAQNYTLHYLRTKENQEVDFALANNNQIEQLIEVKLSDATMSKSLLYFKEKYELPAIQIVKNLKQARTKLGIPLLDAREFLAELYL